MTADGGKTCVLIPVWKDQEGLLTSLEALGRDDSVALDIIVVDDGSPVPINCADRYGNHPVTLLRFPANRGIEAALNHGLTLVFERGYRFLARLDCGDLALAGRIARQIAFLEANPGVGVVGTWAKCTDEHGRHLFTLRLPPGDAAIRRRQRYAPGMLHPSILLRVATLEQAGVYSDRFTTAEDYDFFFRLGACQRMANLPEVLTEYVVSPIGTTTRLRRKSLLARLRVQRAYYDWRDPHATLGILRTLLFIAVPFSWIIAVKGRIWR